MFILHTAHALLLVYSSQKSHVLGLFKMRDLIIDTITSVRFIINRDKSFNDMLGLKDN